MINNKKENIIKYNSHYNILSINIIVILVIVLCITNIWAINFEKETKEYYEQKIQEHICLQEDNSFQSKELNNDNEKIIQQYIYDLTSLDLSSIDYTQLTKTPLLEIKEKINVCKETLNSLDLSSENLKLVLLELEKEYEECVYVLENELYLYPYSQEEYNLLAKAVMREQGDNRSDDEAQMLVACVILNRQANNGINGDLEDPSILDILQEPGQYGKGYSWNVDTSNITDKVWENTRKVLEHEYTAPSNVLFQATFKQGNGVYKAFFNEGYDNYTYFCYL